MKTPEEILREYIDFEDINGSQSVELLPLTITDIILEFGEQCFEAAREQINLSTQHNPKGTNYDNWEDKYLDFEDYLNSLK